MNYELQFKKFAERNEKFYPDSSRYKAQNFTVHTALLFILIPCILRFKSYIYAESSGSNYVKPLTLYYVLVILILQRANLNRRIYLKYHSRTNRSGTLYRHKF
jgi:hypothetical protein